MQGLKWIFLAIKTPFQVVFKAIGGEETIQTWVDETNYRANRYFQRGRNMEDEEKERENDYELCAFLNHYIVIL